MQRRFDDGRHHHYMTKVSDGVAKQEEEESSLDPNFERKLDLITEGAQPHLREHLLTKITKENCQTIIDYILAFMHESNPAQEYRSNTIFRLKKLAEFHHSKRFKDMSREDIIEYLDSLRKPESIDPLMERQS
jgi:hypothetical protein